MPIINRDCDNHPLAHLLNLSAGLAVIGGTALAEHGNRRTTTDVDVILPHDIVDVIEGHLLHHGMVCTAGRGIG